MLAVARPFLNMLFSRQTPSSERERMKAEIVSVGTELLLGQIVDTNAAYIAQRLPALGIDLYWISQVGDNQPRIVEILRRAWSRSDIIIITGGLGPTDDDLTRESIAELLGEQMAVNPDLERELREAFARLKVAMPEHNIKQATLIPSSEALPNPIGTAPGWWVESDGRIIVAMPGVPAEMRLMWEDQALPRLRSRHTGAIIVSRTLKVIGKGESAVEEMIRDFVSSANPTVATYAKPDGIHVRITAKAPSEGEAREMIGAMEAKLRGILGTYVYGADDDTLEGAVGRLLTERGLTLAVVESCSGGYLANMITETPGASRYFKGGLVAYSNEAKIKWGVSEALIALHGAISEEVARAMASAAREQLGADIGIGITGVAGPEQAEGKPVGLVFVALDYQGSVTSTSGTHRATRTDIKRIAATRALNLLRRTLLLA